MSSTNMGSQFGDATYTKVFVGGLAWETHKETMKKYFQQFGEIVEAVVIIDRNTGRSKGYGFVSSHLFFSFLISNFIGIKSFNYIDIINTYIQLNHIELAHRSNNYI